MVQQVQSPEDHQPVRAVKWCDKFNHQKIINLFLSEFPVIQAQVQAIPAQPIQQKMALQ
ncbi:hypothetical protein C1H46_040417 [Malus baccata]|uniref:Uncharacterized protein n=1 Tax=Malus baccata TaxID=106549 RepID=A0A540KII5_MALBA|nr:hypothetical protein C1H46_040417 [Malus baccata]